MDGMYNLQAGRIVCFVQMIGGFACRSMVLYGLGVETYAKVPLACGSMVILFFLGGHFSPEERKMTPTEIKICSLSKS
jgi:hypothetical protein